MNENTLSQYEILDSLYDEFINEFIDSEDYIRLTLLGQENYIIKSEQFKSEVLLNSGILSAELEVREVNSEYYPINIKLHVTTKFLTYNLDMNKLKNPLLINTEKEFFVDKIDIENKYLPIYVSIASKYIINVDLHDFTWADSDYLCVLLSDIDDLINYGVNGINKIEIATFIGDSLNDISLNTIKSFEKLDKNKVAKNISLLTYPLMSEKFQNEYLESLYECLKDKEFNYIHVLITISRFQLSGINAIESNVIEKLKSVCEVVIL